MGHVLSKKKEIDIQFTLESVKPDCYPGKADQRVPGEGNKGSSSHYLTFPGLKRTGGKA